MCCLETVGFNCKFDKRVYSKSIRIKKKFLHNSYEEAEKRGEDTKKCASVFVYAKNIKTVANLPDIEMSKCIKKKEK